MLANYKQGPVDGVWGGGTQSAVRSFQRDHNLGSSGELDVPTLQALNLTGPSQATNDHAVTEPARNDPDANPPPADTNPSAPAR